MFFRWSPSPSSSSICAGGVGAGDVQSPPLRGWGRLQQPQQHVQHQQPQQHVQHQQPQQHVQHQQPQQHVQHQQPQQHVQHQQSSDEQYKSSPTPRWNFNFRIHSDTVVKNNYEILWPASFTSFYTDVFNNHGYPNGRLVTVLPKDQLLHLFTQLGTNM